MKTDLVDCHWLYQHLQDENLVILDAFMQKVVGKSPLEYDEFMTIPGALAFDIEGKCCNPDSGQVHAMPTAEQFTAYAQSLGINNDSLVVLFDNQGIYSAPRAWWTFRLMGFTNVKVLDGGLPAWLESGYPTTNEYAEAGRAGNVTARMEPNRVCNYDAVLASLPDPKKLVLDARSSERFTGQAAEPRPGVRSGHIPGSVNLPFLSLMDGTRFVSPERLTEKFGALGVSYEQELYFSCGTGITACILILAAHSVGFTNTVLYDGSWTDWGTNPELPVEC